MSASRRLVASILAVVILGSSVVASAAPRKWTGPVADPDKAALSEAHALYIAGNRAVEQGRWADALVDFEKSYALSGLPSPLFNVGTTLRALGRHLDARDAFAQLLDKHGDKLDPTVKKQAEQLLQEEKARVAAIVLEGLPDKRDELRIFLDGKTAKDEGTRPLSLEVDPGKHVTRVEDAKAKPFSWDGTLADGETKTVNVKLVPLSVAPPKGDKPKESSSFLSSPVFWTIVGVVVVGGAVGGYLYHRGKQLEPASPNLVKL